jgi:hypothetical protein
LVIFSSAFNKNQVGKKPTQKLNQSVEVFCGFKKESHIFFWCFW